jgi:hypothetical protein
VSASLFDFRDLDVLLKLEAEADDQGWIETAILAETMGVDGNRAVGSRLGWMRRYGMVKYDENKRMWRLTPGAHRVIAARLDAAAAKGLKVMKDEEMIGVMSSVTTHYQHASPMVAAMLRREFLYGTQPGLRRNGRR